MFQRFAACQARRPVATCLVTGASVMSIGDSAVQLCGSGTLDLERNVVVSAYNGGSDWRNVLENTGKSIWVKDRESVGKPTWTRDPRFIMLELDRP